MKRLQAIIKYVADITNNITIETIFFSFSIAHIIALVCIYLMIVNLLK